MTMELPEQADERPAWHEDADVIMGVLAPIGAESVLRLGDHSAHVHFYPGFAKNAWLFTNDFWINGYCLTADFPALPTFREDMKAKPMRAVMGLVMLVIFIVCVGATFYLMPNRPGWEEIAIGFGTMVIFGLLMAGLFWLINRNTVESPLQYRKMQ